MEKKKLNTYTTIGEYKMEYRKWDYNHCHLSDSKFVSANQ